MSAEEAATTELLQSRASAELRQNSPTENKTVLPTLPSFNMDVVKNILPVSTRDVATTIPATQSGSGDDSGTPNINKDATDYFNGWFADSEVEKDPLIPSLSRKQRLLAFVGFATLSIFCLSLSLMMAPFIVLKARKFSLLFSMGSVFALVSVAMLRGPSSFLAYMVAKDQLPTSAAYVGSLAATLYCAMSLRATIPTAFCATIQLLILGRYLCGYVPGGLYGAKMLVKLWWKTLSNVAFPIAKRCLPSLFPN